MRHHFRRRGKNNKLGVLIITLLVIILLYYIFSLRIMPVIKTMALNNARIVATMTINNAVGTVLKQNNINYDSLITLEKDSDGKIDAVKANTQQINLLKYEVTNEVVKEINSINSSNLNIPIGTLFGGQLFTGLGPSIHVTIAPVGNVETNIVNQFTSTGINQTRQQVMLDVDASITIIVSSYNISTNVDSNFDIADTIIVGDVPGTYMVVNGAAAQNTAANIMAYSQANKSSSS